MLGRVSCCRVRVRKRRGRSEASQSRSIESPSIDQGRVSKTRRRTGLPHRSIDCHAAHPPCERWGLACSGFCRRLAIRTGEHGRPLQACRFSLPASPLAGSGCACSSRVLWARPALPLVDRTNAFSGSPLVRPRSSVPPIRSDRSIGASIAPRPWHRVDRSKEAVAALGLMPCEHQRTERPLNPVRRARPTTTHRHRTRLRVDEP